MRLLYLIAMWFHILAAAVWIGGIVFLSVVLLPVTRRPEYLNIASSLFHWTGVRFRVVGWICLGVLLMTGTYIIHFRGFDSIDFWRNLSAQGAIGFAFVIKVLLVVVIFILSAVHDFLIGPRAMKLWQEAPSSPRALSMRRLAGWMGRINLLLALIVLVMAIVIVRGGV